MIIIPDVLGPAELTQIRQVIDTGDWIDGNATSGHQSALAKRNRQLDETSSAAREAGQLVLDALGRAETFIAAALPLKVYPPLFNIYADGEAFGSHVDTAIRIRAGSDFRVRSDLSATLFLSDDYDGGELVIEGPSGDRKIKAPAGHMVLYPSSSLHRVEPVTRGERLASFFWIHSMVRDDGARRILFDLDNATRAVAAAQGAGDRTTVELTGVYHNLLRRWADA